MSDSVQMSVIKRSGNRELLSFDKISARILNLCNNISPVLDSIRRTELIIKIMDQIHNDISTSQIDELVAQQCASQITVHPHYGALASRIVVSNHQKNTLNSFSETMKALFDNRDSNGLHSPLIREGLLSFILENSTEINSVIDYERDFTIDYFGFKTLERAYLMRVGTDVVERPQDMWMRVALAIHYPNAEKAFETYNCMSKGLFTHATPTLFNAGTRHQQLSSCYLIGMKEDSIEGIFDTLKQCAQISKWAGGIGLHIHNVRGEGQRINGTNGVSNGIVPMLKVFNSTARYVDQGGGKRNGSIAIYIEPWHNDIVSYLDLKKNHGDEERRTRDLFLALWIPDLFMESVEKDLDWYLFSPDTAPGLDRCHGDNFNKLYQEYVQSGKFTSKHKARDIWLKILESQMETGVPYILYKDAANSKSNQQNLGTIRSSNLCTEIIEYSDKSETAVCNLGSIALPKFADPAGMYDFESLHEATSVLVRNLDRIIDINFYPTTETLRSNLLHRPIGVGVQGLADTFAIMDLSFDCPEARELNVKIFETIYHAAVQTSCLIAEERENALRNLQLDHVFEKGEDDISRVYSTDISPELAETLGRTKLIPAEIKAFERGSPHGAYSSFMNSPISNGKFQFDLWGVTPSSRYDWSSLRERIKTHGIRNSLLVAPMPTASTAQILGNNECFEPFTSNIYSRRTSAGDHLIINKHLVKELVELNLWSTALKDNIIANQGSIQQIEGLSDHLKAKYRTVWEIPMRSVIDMAADRGAFICQSQSMNLWISEPTSNILTSMHFHSWRKGLKTGQYYLRRRPKHNPQQFTIAPEQNETCLHCSA